MTLSLNDDTHVLCFFQFGDAKTFDVWITCFREPSSDNKPPSWKCHGRHRLYRDHRVFDSDDEKSWFSSDFETPDKDKAISVMREMFDLGILAYENKGAEIPNRLFQVVDGDSDAYLKVLSDLPSIHKMSLSTPEGD